jgi:hypothetical protein
MANRTIQFHAAPSELQALADWLVDTFDSHVVCTEFPPLHRFELSREQVQAAFANTKIRSLAFVVGATAPDSERSAVEDTVALQCSLPKEGQLRQSAIGIRSSKKLVLDAWKNVAKYVHSFTRTGVRVTNPTTGETAISKDFRFSNGALELSRKGIVMHPVAGTNVVTFDES